MMEMDLSGSHARDLLAEDGGGPSYTTLQGISGSFLRVEEVIQRPFVLLS